MQIELKLYGQLRRYRPKDNPGVPHHAFTLTVEEGITGTDLATQLGIPDGLVNAAAVNGEATELNTTLHEGDKVSFFPPSAGGNSV
ncbi:MAG: MoaD/ThiS family protein [Chloroflexi bacterium]|nr:MoaD/ThiS family protein [Chloroflexota bacterium]